MTSATGLVSHEGGDLPPLERVVVRDDAGRRAELGHLPDEPVADLQPTNFHADLRADQFGQRLGHALLDRLDRVLLEEVRHE